MLLINRFDVEAPSFFILTISVIVMKIVFIRCRKIYCSATLTSCLLACISLCQRTNQYSNPFEDHFHSNSHNLSGDDPNPMLSVHFLKGHTLESFQLHHM